ncbi:hypothetical protein M8494_11720 [Serratia ureilytica]
MRCTGTPSPPNGRLCWKSHARITILDPEGKCEVADFGPGDGWYFPESCCGHSIQALADGAHFILAFDNGHFSSSAPSALPIGWRICRKEVLEKASTCRRRYFPRPNRARLILSVAPFRPPCHCRKRRRIK